VIANVNAEFKLINEAGEVVQVERTHNLIVNSARALLLAASSAAQYNTFKYLAIGSSATAVTLSDTALGTELTRHEATVVYSVVGSTPTLTFNYTFPAGTGTGTVQEAGLFNASSGVTMLNRMLTGTIDKQAGYSLVATITLT
jgi:hypothetical protein